MTEPEVAALERWANELDCQLENLDEKVLALCAAWRAQQAEIARLHDLLDRRLPAAEARLQDLERAYVALDAVVCRQQHSVP